MRMRLLQLAAAVCVLGAVRSLAAVLYVDVSNPIPIPPYTNWCTAATNIQDGVDAASAGDLILVTNGVYSSGGRPVKGYFQTNRVALTRPVTVQSMNGPEVTVIQGYQVPETTNGAAAVRCAYLTNGALLSGFTLTNGATSDRYPEVSAAGAWCESSAAVLTNCTLANNYAIMGWGGGAYQGTLKNCRLIGNCGNTGGGAYSCTLNNCTLTGNWALYGGGVFYGTLEGCTLDGNWADDSGGAFYATLKNCMLISNFCTGGMMTSGGGGSFCTLNNCTLIGNHAPGGGATYAGTLSNCTLASNHALTQGGGALGGTLDHCTLIGNSAQGFAYSAGFGGGACMSTLNNCTLAGNSARDFGGGVWNSTLNNCTLTGNSAEEGGGAYESTLNNCIAYYNTTSDYDISYGGALNYCCTFPLPSIGVGNFTNAPIFVDYGAGNLRLQSNSPCINAGYNSYVPGDTDLDGYARIKGGTVDTGAYEFQDPASVISYAWLQSYGLPNNGLADYLDTDGDSMNNWQEWIAGTHPTNSRSLLRLQTPSMTPSSVLLCWSSETNHDYFVERATTLQLPLLFRLLQANIPGQESITFFNDQTAPPTGAAFYRVGTDSSNGLPALQLQTPAFVPAALVVTWSSVTDRTYVVERSVSPFAPREFQPIQSNIAGLSGTTSFADKNVPISHPVFYRVRVQP
jgi:hypothetical protein